MPDPRWGCRRFSFQCTPPLIGFPSSMISSRLRFYGTNFSLDLCHCFYFYWILAYLANVYCQWPKWVLQMMVRLSSLSHWWPEVNTCIPLHFPNFLFSPLNSFESEFLKFWTFDLPSIISQISIFAVDDSLKKLFSLVYWILVFWVFLFLTMIIT